MKYLTTNQQITEAFRSIILRMDAILAALWDGRITEIQDYANDARQIAEAQIESPE